MKDLKNIANQFAKIKIGKSQCYKAFSMLKKKGYNSDLAISMVLELVQNRVDFHRKYDKSWVKDVENAYHS